MLHNLGNARVFPQRYHRSSEDWIYWQIRIRVNMIIQNEFGVFLYLNRELEIHNVRGSNADRPY